MELTGISFAVGAIGIGMIIAAVLLNGRAAHQPRGLDARLAEIDRRQKLIMQHLGIPDVEPAYVPEVRALAAQGQLIAAVKLYREHTGASLVDAKRAVDEISGR